MVDQPKRKRRRATTSPLPVWWEELDKLSERRREHPDVVRAVACSNEPLALLLQQFAESRDDDERAALMAQCISRGSSATHDLLAVVDAAPIKGPFELACASLSVLREIHDYACVEPLIPILERHSNNEDNENNDSLCLDIIATLGAFGFDLPQPAVAALWSSSNEEFRANLLEACAIAHIHDSRALEVAIAELDEEPIFASALLAEWGDKRAVGALRNRLARIDPLIDSDWVDASWHITEALFRLGAELSDDERALRRRAVSARPEGLRDAWAELVRTSNDKLRLHPAAMAKILVDHAGDVAVRLLRGLLTVLSGNDPHGFVAVHRDLKWATDVIVLVDAIGQLTDLEPHETKALDAARSIVNARLARFAV